MGGKTQTKTHHTLGAVPKSIRNIVERGKIIREYGVFLFVFSLPFYYGYRLLAN
jgi:hypothetical protein